MIKIVRKREFGFSTTHVSEMSNIKIKIVINTIHFLNASMKELLHVADAKNAYTSRAGRRAAAEPLWLLDADWLIWRCVQGQGPIDAAAQQRRQMMLSGL